MGFRRTGQERACASVPGCRGSASRRFGAQVVGLDEVALFEAEFVDEFIDGPVDAVGEGAKDLSVAEDQLPRVGPPQLLDELAEARPLSEPLGLFLSDFVEVGTFPDTPIPNRRCGCPSR